MIITSRVPSRVLGYSVLITVLITVLLSSPGHATLSRLSALGAEPVFYSRPLSNHLQVTNLVNGSLWYEDSYNIFYNPAYIHDFKNAIFLESNREVGLFLAPLGHFVLGAYYNRGGDNAAESNYAPGLITPGLSVQAETLNGELYQVPILNTSNPLDFFLGVEVNPDFKLAGHFGIASGTAERATTQYYHADVGAVIVNMLHFFGGSTFKTRYDGSDSFTPIHQANHTLRELTLGLRVTINNWSPYFAIHRYYEEINPTLPAFTLFPVINGISTEMAVSGTGIGHQLKILPRLNTYQHIGIFLNQISDYTTREISNTKIKTLIVPINLAAEYQFYDWLILRGGFQWEIFHSNFYPIYNPQTKNIDQSSNADRPYPDFRLGVTTRHKGLALDVALGNHHTIEKNQYFFFASVSWTGFEMCPFFCNSYPGSVAP